MPDPDHETTLQSIDRASLPQELSYDPLAESDIAHRVRVRHLTKMAELRIVEDARAEVATAANPRTDLFFKAEAIRDELQLLVDVYAVLENRHELKHGSGSCSTTSSTTFRLTLLPTSSSGRKTPVKTVQLTQKQLEQVLRDAAVCASYAALHVPATEKRISNAAWRLLARLEITRRIERAQEGR